MDRTGARIVVRLIAVLALASALSSAPARADDQLVVPTDALSHFGFRPAGASVRAAEREVGVVTASDVQASAAVGRGGTLTSAAFVLGSTGAAHRVVSAWKRSHHAHPFRVGQDGAIAKRPAGKGAVFTIVWRRGARVGLLQVRSSGRDQSAVTKFVGMADARLTAVLPSTAYEQVLAQIRPDGSVSQQTALQAFALSYGPLPGVHPPSGASQRIPSATLAGTWILPYIPRLSPTLRSVVLQRLGFPSATTARVASYGDANFMPSPGLTAEASLWAQKEGELLPGRPTLKLTIVAGSSSSVADGADAYPVDASGDENNAGPYCRIRLSDSFLNGDGANQQVLELFMAHEVFHCWEFQLAPSQWQTDDAWRLEGLAEWMAIFVTDSTYALVDAAWSVKDYVESPSAPLFERSYDADGFWGHVEDTTHDLPSRIPQILTAPSNVAAFVAAGGDQDPLLTTWGSSIVRAAGAGPDWQMYSPLRPPDEHQLYNASAVDQVDHFISVIPAYATGQVSVQSPGPLVHISVVGHGRLGVDDNYTDLSDAWFCVDPKGCQCPQGLQGEVPKNRPLKLGSLLAFASDAIPGSASIDSHSVREFCSGVFIHQIEPGGSNHTVAHFNQPAKCVLQGGTLTVTLTGGPGTLTITAPDFASLPKRSDGATVITFYSPLGRGAAGAHADYQSYSTGDVEPADAPREPFGSATIAKDRKSGFIAASLFAQGNPAARVAGGPFGCR